MSSHYVNLGRWAESIIGPFDFHTEADRYIDTLDWCGLRPEVVTIAPPDEQKIAKSLRSVTVSLTLAEAEAISEIVGVNRSGPIARFGAYNAVMRAIAEEADESF